MIGIAKWAISWGILAGGTVSSMIPRTTKGAVPLIGLAALAGVYMMTLPQPAPNLIWWMTALAGTGGLALPVPRMSEAGL